MKIKFLLIILFPFLFFFLIDEYHSDFKGDKVIDFNISYLKETNNSISLNNLDEFNFNVLPKSNSLGISNGTYWFKLDFDKTFQANDLIGYIPTHNIDKIEIYKNNKSTVNYITSIGNNVLRKDLILDYQFPSFLINLEIDNKTTYYLKVRFVKEANFPIKILNENEFLNYIMIKKTINSLYYGTCVIIVLLNLFFFFKLKDNVYLFYSLFLLSLMINFLMYDGSLINLFRGNNFYYSLELIIHVSNELWFLLFSIKFLNLHIKNPIATKLFFIFPSAVLVFYAYYYYSNNFIYIAISDAIGISLFPILWFYGILNMKNMVYARFYVLGYLLLVPLSVFFIIGYPFGFWKVNGDMSIVKISSWLDILVFTYAITYRMKIKIHKYNSELLEMQQLFEETKQIKTEKEKNTNSYLLFLKDNNYSNTPLTSREIDILKLLNEGDSNKLISEKLFISPNTVKSHIRNIYNKMDVKNRDEIREKLLNLNPLKSIG